MSRGEEALGPVVGLGLHVLAEGERHRPAVGRVGHHPHRAGQRGQQLLGPRDAVEIAADGAEAVVGADRAVAEILDLLQHRVGRRGWRRRRPGRTAPAAGSHGRAPPPSPCSWPRARWRRSPSSPAAGRAAWHRRWPHAPSSARSGPGRSASASREAVSASPRPATLPWPKIAQHPAMKGSPSSVIWAESQRTIACAAVSRIVVMRLPFLRWRGPRPRAPHRRAYFLCHRRDGLVVARSRPAMPSSRPRRRRSCGRRRSPSPADAARRRRRTP